MHYFIALLLLALWVLGWFFFKLVGAAIHLLLVLAVIALLARFLTTRRSSIKAEREADATIESGPPK